MPFNARSYARRKMWYSFQNYQRKKEAYDRKYGDPLVRSLSTLMIYLFILFFTWAIFGENIPAFWWILLPVSLPGMIGLFFIGVLIYGRIKYGRWK